MLDHYGSQQYCLEFPTGDYDIVLASTCIHLVNTLIQIWLEGIAFSSKPVSIHIKSGQDELTPGLLDAQWPSRGECLTTHSDHCAPTAPDRTSPPGVRWPAAGHLVAFQSQFTMTYSYFGTFKILECSLTEAITLRYIFTRINLHVQVKAKGRKKSANTLSTDKRVARYKGTGRNVDLHKAQLRPHRNPVTLPHHLLQPNNFSSFVLQVRVKWLVGSDPITRHQHVKFSKLLLHSNSH